MSPQRKVAIAGVTAILLIGGLSVAYIFNLSSTMAGKDQTISSLDSAVRSLASRSFTTTISVTSATTSTVSATTIQFPNAPWNGPLTYLATADVCNAGYSGACFSSELGQAFVFTCQKAAATSQGCTVQINATKSLAFEVVTVWYPSVNQTGAPSWSNCAFGNSPANGVSSTTSSRFYAYCIPVGANGFVLTLPPPPHP